MSSFRDAYREFTGKTPEEALRAARDEFGVDLNELDFEILTPGSRGVLGMGAEPARVLAAPRSALGGTTPKREAAAQVPLPPPPAHDREDRPRFDRDRGGDRGGRPAWVDRGGDRGPSGFDRDRGPRPPRPEGAPMRDGSPRPGGGAGRPDRGPGSGHFDRDRGRRPDGVGRGPRPDGRPAPQAALTAKELAEVAAARVAPPIERPESAEVTPEAMAAAKEILEQLMAQLDFHVTVEIRAGETNRLNVVGEGSEKESLGALIGRKGERLSALQHLVNLLLSKKVGEWTRILVDVEDYRGRRERQLRDLANRAAERVLETGKMLQLEPMPALERRWIHLALRDHDKVATQSIGEEPNRRVVVLPREL
ncbi:MAG: RNA-binding cell elongation regulator Jag/EloR [Candidatus Limnocylindrales bacterium]|jgi:spoIIIJ-associated protein